jgi:GLPGLI family protein
MFSFSCFSQTRNGIIYYSKKLNRIDLNETNKTSKKDQLMLEDIQQHIENFEYLLKFNETSAVYKQIEETNSDNSLDLINLQLAKIFAGFNGLVYYDKLHTIKQFDFTGQKFLIEHKTNQYDWKLTNENQNICGYNSYKATLTEKIEGSWGSKDIEITAWYTPDIPLNYGPDGYSGLPGLIIHLERNNIITYFNKIELFDNVIEIRKPTKGRRVSFEEFNKIASEINSNRSN